MKKPEELVIIGGGLEGCYAALLAAQITDPDTETGFKYHIRLLEKHKDLFDGASLIASRLHLGGEYPMHLQTGKDCLKGAIITALLWGDKIKQIYTDQKPMRFLIANPTEVKGKLTVAKFEEHYEQLRQEYDGLFRQVMNGRFNGDETRTKNALFGLPQKPGINLKDAFYHPLTPAEIKPFKDIAGGFQSRERGINVARELSALQMALEKVRDTQGNLEVLYDTEVPENGIYYDEDPKTCGPKPFEVHTKRGIFLADQIINAAWDKGPALLKKHIEDPEKFPEVYAHHRAMLVVETDMHKKMPPPTFIMDPDGEHGGMWAPWNMFCGLVYLPLHGKAYHGSKLLTREDPHLPDSWGEKLVDTWKAQIDYLRTAYNGLFPFLEHTEAKRLIVRNTLSFNKELTERPHEQSWELDNQPGHHVMCATKMTLAAQSAIEAVQAVQARSRLRAEGRGSSPLPADTYKPFEAVINGTYSIEHLVEVNLQRAREFAEDHDLPRDAEMHIKSREEKQPDAATVTKNLTGKTRSFGQGFGPDLSHHVKMYTEGTPATTTGMLLPQQACKAIGAWVEQAEDGRPLNDVIAQHSVSGTQLANAIHSRLVHLDAIEMARLVPTIIPYLSANARDALFSEATAAQLPPALWKHIRESRPDTRLPESDDPGELGQYLWTAATYDAMAPIGNRENWQNRLSKVASHYGARTPFTCKLAVHPDMEVVSEVFPMLFGALSPEKRQEVGLALIQALHEAGSQEEKKFFAPLRDPNVNMLQFSNPDAAINVRRIFNNGRSLQVEFMTPRELQAGKASSKIPSVSFWDKEFLPIQFHFHRNQNIADGVTNHSVVNEQGDMDGKLEFRLYRNPDEANACEKQQAADPNDNTVGELHAIYMHKELPRKGSKQQHRTALALCAHVTLDKEDKPNPDFGRYLDAMRQGLQEKFNITSENRTYLKEGEEIIPARLPYQPLECYNHEGRSGLDAFSTSGIPSSTFTSMNLGHLTLNSNGRIVLSEGGNDVFYRGVYAVHLPEPITISKAQLAQAMELQQELSVLDDKMSILPLDRTAGLNIASGRHER